MCGGRKGGHRQARLIMPPPPPSPPFHAAPPPPGQAAGYAPGIISPGYMPMQYMPMQYMPAQYMPMQQPLTPVISPLAPPAVGKALNKWRRHQPKDTFFSIGRYGRVGLLTASPKVNSSDSAQIQIIGQTFGCHTCGAHLAAGQIYIGDHQPPTKLFNADKTGDFSKFIFAKPTQNCALFKTSQSYLIRKDIWPQYAILATWETAEGAAVQGKAQFLFPQCQDCSGRQGGFASATDMAQYTAPAPSMSDIIQRGSLPSIIFIPPS